MNTRHPDFILTATTGTLGEGDPHPALAYVATLVQSHTPVALVQGADEYTPTAADRATVRGFILGL